MTATYLITLSNSNSVSNSTVCAVMTSAARLSANVLPGIPTCSGTQENVMSICVLLCVVRSWLRRFGRDVDVPIVHCVMSLMNL